MATEKQNRHQDNTGIMPEQPSVDVFSETQEDKETAQTSFAEVGIKSDAPKLCTYSYHSRLIFIRSFFGPHL